MPRATDFSMRLVLDRMLRLGATAAEIARQLDLPLSTVRGLIARARQAAADQSPEALLPRYHACGPRPLAPPPALQTTVELRRQHPRWGAGRIRVELMRMDLQYELPSVRTIQRWLRLHDLAPAPAGRRPRGPWQRAEHPHDTWQADAADQKRLANGDMVSWLRVVDECSGAALRSHIFFPGLLHAGSFGTGTRRIASLF
jgi:transposase